MNNRNTQMGNRILFNKSVERNQQTHLKKLREISSIRITKVQKKSEISANQLELNKKKREYQEESKHTEIERENRILLEKITNIMHTKGEIKLPQEKQSVHAGRSLNEHQRKIKQVQIAKENQVLLKRLIEKKANYNITRYDTSWYNVTNSSRIQTPKPSNLVTEGWNYSIPLSAPNANGIKRNRSSRSEHTSHSLSTINGIEQKEKPQLLQSQQQQQSDNLNNFAYSGSRSNSASQQQRNNVELPKIADAKPINSNRNSIIWEGRRKVNEILLDLKIVPNENFLKIKADEVEGVLTHVMEIPIQEAYSIIGEQNENIEGFLSRLRIIGEKLCLIGGQKVQQQQINK